MRQAAKKLSLQVDFFEVRFNSILTNEPLPYDLYLVVDRRPVLFRKRGDVITDDRIKQLQGHGAKTFLCPEEQRPLYMNSLRQAAKNPDQSIQARTKYIRESAFVHIQDLFTKTDIQPVVTETKAMVQDMVSLVSEDMAAVVSLMRLSTHDYYTYNHSVDVAVYSIALARRFFGEHKDVLLMAGMAGLLHDIGKRKIDLKIINKPNKLTPEEWEEMKRHPSYGFEMVENLPTIPQEAKEAVHQHHENFDGTGYPTGLKEEEISKLARIVTIADVFDALTTKRSYHSAINAQEALDTMYGMQPGKFDPQIFSNFNKNFATKADLVLPDDYDPCTEVGSRIKKK